MSNHPDPTPVQASGGFPTEDELLSDIVVNNAIVGICYMSHRRFIWTNPRMAEMLGYGAGELDGQDVRILYLSEEEYIAVGQAIYGRAPTDMRYAHERRLLRKDGTHLWCSISGSFIDPNDPQQRAVWVVQDISQRRQAEEELRETNLRLEQIVEERTRSLQKSNEALQAEVDQRRVAQLAMQESREKYRALFRNLPLGVLVRDQHGNLIEANRTLHNYLGVSSKSALEDMVNDAELIVLDGRSQSLGKLLDAMAENIKRRSSLQEFTLIRDGGEKRTVTVIATPLSVERHGILFTFADVTDQRSALERERQQQEALAHASRLSLMGQMTSALAHELGQPLNASQSYVGGLMLRIKDGAVGPNDVSYALEKVDLHLQQAAAIIRNVRSFVTRQRLEFETTDVAALVTRTLALVGSQLRTSGVRVSVETDGSSLVASCNPVEIQQVLVNLIVNAIDAMRDCAPELRCIAMRIERESKAMISISVTDQGAGIPADLADKLFEPYFTTKKEGLGMGLRISKTIIESHGGNIRREPTARGARFKFTLRGTP